MRLFRAFHSISYRVRGAAEKEGKTRKRSVSLADSQTVVTRTRPLNLAGTQSTRSSTPPRASRGMTRPTSWSRYYVVRYNARLSHSSLTLLSETASRNRAPAISLSDLTPALVPKIAPVSAGIVHCASYVAYRATKSLRAEVSRVSCVHTFE